MGAEHRIPLSELDLLNNRMARLERQVRLMKGAARSPTMPKYDPEFPLDAVDGQHALQAGAPYYYSDGAWHPFTDVPIYGTTFHSVVTCPGFVDPTAGDLVSVAATMRFGALQIVSMTVAFKNTATGFGTGPNYIFSLPHAIGGGDATPGMYFGSGRCMGASALGAEGTPAVPLYPYVFGSSVAWSTYDPASNTFTEIGPTNPFTFSTTIRNVVTGTVCYFVD